MTTGKSLQELFGSVIPGGVQEGEAPKAPPKPRLDLPLYTFLIGDQGETHLVARALCDQSEFVYIDDFKGPLYDAVAMMLGLGYDADMGSIETQGKQNPLAKTPETLGDLVQSMLKACSNVDFVRMFTDRTHEANYGGVYQFVVRDAAEFDFTPLITRAGRNWAVVDIKNRKVEDGRTGNTTFIPSEASITLALREIFK